MSKPLIIALVVRKKRWTWLGWMYKMDDFFIKYFLKSISKVVVPFSCIMKKWKSCRCEWLASSIGISFADILPMTIPTLPLCSSGKECTGMDFVFLCIAFQSLPTSQVANWSVGTEQENLNRYRWLVMRCFHSIQLSRKITRPTRQTIL